MAAGNDGEELPDYNVQPATRTPGVITVGALDSSDQARSDSNYGSSVDIWAPGDNIPVAPDDDNPNGTYSNGTSAAAPIVSGVVAMLRYLDPSIDSVADRAGLLAAGCGKNSGSQAQGTNPADDDNTLVNAKKTADKTIDVSYLNQALQLVQRAGRPLSRKRWRS